MAIRFVIEDNLGTPTVSRNIALNGIDVDTATSEVQKDRWFWRWYDEPDMEPQFLAEGVAGQPVSAPFDTQGRSVIFYRVSHDQVGNATATHPRDAEQFLYVPPTAPTLSRATFSTPHINLTFIANGGTGDINISRRTGTDDFAVIATATSTATTYSDTPPLNGTYDYKLTQVGLPDESLVKSATVTGGSSGSGTPSTDLAAVWDSAHTVALTWTAFGSSGTYVVERSIDGGAWSTLASGLSSASYNDTDAAPTRYTRIFQYRVSRTSVSGYTNTTDAEIAGTY